MCENKTKEAKQVELSDENDTYLDNQLSNIKTLDLIGFRGTKVLSNVLSNLQLSQLLKLEIKPDFDISHVGLAIRLADLTPYLDSTLQPLNERLSISELYIIESTKAEYIPDIFGKFFFGVQIRPLRGVIKSYKGKVFHSKREFKVTDNDLLKFSEFIVETNHRPFENSIPVILGNFFECLKTDIQSSKSLFCSEMVARCLMHIGYLKKNINPERVVPMDFFPNPKESDKTMDIDEEIPLLYTEPLEIKFHPDSPN